MKKLWLSLFLPFLLTACGQSGPLYLPPQPNKPVLTHAPARETTPAPGAATPGKPLLQKNILTSS
jgi:predicted small lipoprotein YifL